MLSRRRRRKAPWVFLALWLCTAGLPPASRAQEASAPLLEEQRIVAVRVVSETGEVIEENPQLSVRANTPYDSEAVREGLRQLFRTGRYADVRVEAADVPGGVRLDFIVRPNLYVDTVHVVGLQEPPSEAVALASLRLALGQIYSESLMKEAVGHLQETLVEEGFYNARIEYETTPVPATRQMNILVRVTPGRRARLGTIEVHNQTAFANSEILRRSKLRSGRDIRARRLERASDRLRKFLVSRGYLGARVVIRRGEYDAQSNRLPVTLEVSAGSSVRAEVQGVKISKGDLRELVPIYQEGAVDEDLLQEGRRNIRDYMERRGYFDAQVRYDVSEDAEKGQSVITYTVDRGPRRRLVGVAFEGNHYFNSELLRARLNILPAKFLSPGRFSQRLLSDDEDSLRELYVANGFREVQVTGEVVEDYRGKEGDLFVRFHVVEGEQTRVAELIIEGNHAFSEETLLNQAIDSSPGQPYSEFNAAGDRDNVLALYFNEGYPEANFEWEAEETGEPNRVRLHYRITEGPQVTVARALVSGREFTREGVIDREVQIKPGDPLREGDIVETQRRLYNLGIFSRVSIAPQNPEGTEPAKTVVVQVEEGKRYTIAYGFGFEVQRLGSGGADPVNGKVRASPRGLFEVTRLNFTGRAHTVSFKVRGSTLQGRALLSYTAPNFFGRPNFNLLLLGLADRTRDVRTFTSTRYEASGQIEHRLGPYNSVLYRYFYRRVLVDPNSLRISPDQIPLFSQPTKVSGFGITYIRERRDNPADAVRGNFNTLDFNVAHRSLGSSASFFRVFAQNSSFHPLGRGVVFARSARIGFEEPFSGSSQLDIPLPERFFAGGGNSLRGFGLNQAGPRDPTTGFPVGGLAMLVFNQELRFPMQLPFVGSGKVGGAIFYDAGNVFCRADRITLRSSINFRQGDPSNATPCERNGINELRFLSHTIGFGIRYATPIGPVRLDLGYLLNSQRIQFCAPSATMTSPGCPMNNILKTNRLPRFQFFFNIGSIF